MPTSRSRAGAPRKGAGEGEAEKDVEIVDERAGQVAAGELTLAHH